MLRKIFYECPKTCHFELDATFHSSIIPEQKAMTTIIHQFNSIQDGNPQIAKGAFGTIDIAVSFAGSISEHDHHVYSYVALKTIRNAICPSRDPYNDSSNKPKLTPSVFAELAALRVLSSDARKHDNVTQLLSVITSSKTSYDHDLTFVFPYCPIDLHQIILSHRFSTNTNTKNSELHLPIPIIRTAFRDILKGLNHIHSVGIIHCDMKPGNILLSSEGVFQLADFGLARLIILPKDDETDINTQAIAGLCTLPYRPPEILFGSEDYQPSVDMWGAGLILCEMLSGRALFYGINVLDTLSRIIDVLGTPSSDNWEGIDKLRDYGKVGFAPTNGVGLVNVVNKLRDDGILERFVGRIVIMDPAKRFTPNECLVDTWMQGGVCSRQDLCEKLIPKDFINDYDGYRVDDLDDVMKLHLLEQMKLSGAKIACAKRDFSFCNIDLPSRTQEANKNTADCCVEVSDELAGLLSLKMESNENR